MVKALMFGAGASKGFMFIGSLKKLIENQKIEMDKIEIFAGISIGGIIAFILSLGYSISDMETFILEVDFKYLEVDPDIETLIEKFGVNTGERIIHVFEFLLQDKLGVKDISFKELFDKTNKKLILQATNISLLQLETFSVDLTPDLSVVTALRMTLSIPIIFTPVAYNGHLYIDPGINTGVPVVGNELLKALSIELSDILFFEIFYKTDSQREIDTLGEYLTVVFRSFLCHKRWTSNEINVITLCSNSETIFPNRTEIEELIISGYEQTSV